MIHISYFFYYKQYYKYLKESSKFYSIPNYTRHPKTTWDDILADLHLNDILVTFL